MAADASTPAPSATLHHTLPLSGRGTEKWVNCIAKRQTSQPLPLRVILIHSWIQKLLFLGKKQNKQTNQRKKKKTQSFKTWERDRKKANKTSHSEREFCCLQRYHIRPPLCSRYGIAGSNLPFDDPQPLVQASLPQPVHSRLSRSHTSPQLCWRQGFQSLQPWIPSAWHRVVSVGWTQWRRRHRAKKKTRDRGAKLQWVRAQIPPLSNWVTLGRFLNLSVPRFPCL